MNTLQVCLHTSSDDPAVIISGKSARTISHKALASNVNEVRKSLAANGLGRGTKVAVVLTNPFVFTVTFVATALQAATVAPLNPGLKGNEIQGYLEDLGAEWIVLSPEEVEKQGPAYTTAKTLGLKVATSTTSPDDDKQVSLTALIPSQASTTTTPLPEPSPSDVCLILGTSGTTGRPKRVPLTHANLARSIHNIVAHYALGPTDRAPVIMPLFHIHGLVAGLFAPLASRGALILTPTGGLTPGFLRDAVAHGATWYTATPTLHRLTVRMPVPAEGRPGFRFVRSCSSRLDAGLLRALEERFGCVVVEAYAMTEAAHQVCGNPVDAGRRRERSVGLPSGVEVRVVDEAGKALADGDVGEIAIKGENVMKGYLGNEEANAKAFTEDGYFRTGDQGKIGEGGFVYLTGRIKELINKGGEKISPVEIDDVINQHPDVSEAVSFAMADEMYGEDVGAAVVLQEGANLDAAQLKQWTGERLLQAKVPKTVYFVDSIPKTPVGKMQRSLVADTVIKG